MYIRVNTTPNSPRKSIQIVESVRTGDKVRQKIVHYVGIALDDREEEKLKNYAQELIAKITAERMRASKQLSLFPVSDDEVLQYIKNKPGRKHKKRLKDVLPTSQVTLDDIKEKDRIVEGIHEVGNAVYNLLGYDSILQKRDDSILRDLVLTRLAFPASKHKTQHILTRQFDKEHNLDTVYRMMDKLYERIDKIKQCTFEHMRSLFPHKVDLVLFDVTTLYFETTEVDELKQFGYSKDCRFNTTQVVLALATNEDGLPIGYELFEGNKAEVKTLVTAIEHWKTLFDIGSVCFIGDRAMFCEDNLKLMEENGYKYIVAAKLRKLPKNLKAELLEEVHYHPTVLNNSFAWIGEFNHNNRRLVVSYKTKRALKDNHERQNILNKIQRTIGKKGKTLKLVTNQGVRKFTTTDADSQTIIDANKVAQDALWDGLHGVITNIADDKPESLIARYARLWVIEESFRINKHLLKIRPIFHWKPRRIHTHIAMCYMTFAILRHLQYRVSLTQKISPEVIIAELLQVQASIHIHKRTKDLYRVPGNFSNIARKIYKAFDIVRSEDAEPYFP